MFFMKRLRPARELLGLLLFVLGLVMVPMIVYAQGTGLTPGGLTPEKLIAAFNSVAPILMFAWGIVHTRWKALEHWPNDLVPWINAVGYIVGAFAVGQIAPVAHAADGAVRQLTGFAWLVWNTAYGASLAAVTSLLYDKFAKAAIDRLVPKP
jgi:hypothetical protein